MNLSFYPRCLFSFVLLFFVNIGIIAGASSHNGAAESGLPFMVTNEGIISAKNAQQGKTNLLTKELVSPPTECEISDAEINLLEYYPSRKGQKITRHKVMPIEKKVSSDFAYNYGYYEISGTEGGRPFGPHKMAYLILWKKLDNQKWKMYLDIWEYSDSSEAKDLYFF